MFVSIIINLFVSKHQMNINVLFINAIVYFLEDVSVSLYILQVDPIKILHYIENKILSSEMIITSACRHVKVWAYCGLY